MYKVVFVLMVVSGSSAQRNSSVYGFYRSMGSSGKWGPESEVGTRRVFGGQAAELQEHPAVCALLDRYWSTRCSAAVVAPRWVLTAAHCISPRVAYVKYNSRHPASPDGKVAAVHYLYRHPRYKVLQEDEGRGLDVTLLNHDVGLVRTREMLTLTARFASDPLVAMRLYNPADLKNEEIKVMGFGRTELSRLGEELFSVKLQLVVCERGAWFHCVCGVARGQDTRGVCSGDSGGPVLYRGVQVGVTSMGPMECGRGGSAQGLAPSATSVFTALFNYADVINATIHDTEEALRMSRIAKADPVSKPLALTLVAPFVQVLIVR